MYKNVCYKIIVYVLVGCLSFGVPATTYYKSVHAIEFLGGALAFEEALKWLLALVGVTAVGSAASQVDWSEVREQCVEVQLHNGASQAQVSEWWAKLSRGTLDKASSCWDSFLSWCNSLTDSSGSGSGGVLSFPCSGYDCVDFIANYLGYSGTYVNSQINNVTNVGAFALKGINTDSVHIYLYHFNNDNISDISATISDGYVYFRSSSGFYVSNFYIYPDRVNNDTIVTAGGTTNNSSLQITSVIGNAKPYNIIYDCSGLSSGNDSSVLNLSGISSPISSDWQSAIDVAKQNLELLNRDLPDENASEVAIPMPGLSDSDDEASADAYDNIIDAINDGTITLDDGIAQIQDLLHVLVIDDTTDIVQPVRPDPDTGEDQTKEDVIKENKSNMGFTLAGLEKVFPFCIPFDIYAFMTLLVAEPVAPEFDFPIKSVNNQTENIHIDLSPFEPVAVVVRYIFDFLFIIGLALMTRSLIGGGSSD